MCDWVFADEGVATRKYDGTCVMLDETGKWWARREVKPGKKEPDNYLAVETDPNTGKTVGWEPIQQSAFVKYHAEALAIWVDPPAAGTYELIGPKVNGNPEKVESHRLVKHSLAEVTAFLDGGRTYERVKEAMGYCREDGVEGIVFHHPDGRMAKIKVRDFPA